MASTNTIKALWNSPTMGRLFDSGGIGFVVVAPDQSVLDASETFCRKLGYSREELLQMHVSDYTHPEDQVMTSNLFQHVTESNLVQVFEKRYVTRDGKIMWCKLRSEAVYDEQGEVLYRIVMVEDITREKQNELELELMAAITKSSDDAIFRFDADGIIEFWGKGAERMYGYTSGEAIGQHASLIVPDPKDPQILDILDKLARGQTVRNPDALARTRDGSLKEISVLIFPIRNKAGKITAFASVHRDISAFKQLEIQLQHSQRLETAGLLAGGIAHDFNNIITVIQGASNLLAQELGQDGGIHNHLTLIERSAERATRLTRQLLAFSRKQKISPTIIDPNRLVEESHALLHRALGEQVKLVTELHSSRTIREDATQLEQVLLNLAVNARHAMPRGGTLTITTRDMLVEDYLLPEQEGFLNYAPAKIKPGEYVCISVRDTGYGMDKNTLEHIFDPFFTTKPKGEGTGLGLSVVYGMITQVGGCINVLSYPGRGTQFELYLPHVRGETNKHADQQSRVRAKQTGRILIIEDDDGVRALTSALLEDAGYQVFQADSPRKVLDGKVETDVDLILSDVMMPDMSGPEFAELWLDEHPHSNFLFMSGYYEDSSFTQSLKGKPLIQKPFKPAALLDAVAGCLGKHDS